MDSAAGEASARFDEFAASVSGPLLRLAFARTGNTADAEDLVQEALIAAHRKWDVVGGYQDPALWARRVVLNHSVSRWRRRGRERLAVARLADRRLAVDGNEPVLADEALWAAVRTLSARQRDVVLLLWFEDLPVSDVAVVLGCGEETVRTHWRRARAKLAEQLGDDDVEDDEWR
ncbi:MAG: sigma-70 family RNA polymerase sigma factor [Acidimicrobiia bacterium]|nr:sigma-70 family RNA polymerase sigma factor [Acidimicrobiia bacterium]